MSDAHLEADYEDCFLTDETVDDYFPEDFDDERDVLADEDDSDLEDEDGPFD